MDLLGAALARHWHRIAFVGIAKHAGKTTALNAFVAQAEARRQTVGLLSIGLDGERLDTIMGVAKPSIEAPVGTLVASAERALADSDAGFEYLHTVPIDSPLGNVLIARVTRPGGVVLAGIRQRDHVQHVIPRLIDLGADLCLVDGAFDRVAAAAPHLVDAMVLATGAIAGRTVQEAVRRTAPFVRRFQLPEAGPSLKQALAEAHTSHRPGFLVDGRLTVAETPLAGRSPIETPHWSADVDVLYLPGAVTTMGLAQLLAHPKPLQLVVGHPAQLLTTPDVLEQWFRRGHTVFVWDVLPIVAIAVNPHSITGYTLPRDELMREIARLAPEVPVFDAMETGDGHVDNMAPPRLPTG